MNSPTPCDMSNPGASPLRHGFTIVELLVVMSILVVLLSLVVTPVKSILDRHHLTGAGSQVSALVERARIHATTTQRVTSLRFYPDTTTKAIGHGFRNIGVYEITPNTTGTGLNAKPITRNFKFNEPVIVSSSRSSAFQNATIISGTGTLQRVAAVPYREIYFYPDGSTSLTASSPNPYFTVVSLRDEENLTNPFVISLDPVTSRVTIFRR
jgi:uncharacterized protein (TIGR02596 family)